MLKSNREAWWRSYRLEAAEYARKATEIASDRQASDILLLDVRKICSFADYFVICSSETNRHSEALKEVITKGLKEMGGQMLHAEGDSSSGWVLLDYGDVIVHIFSRTEREYYQLDELWRDGTTVVRIQ